MHRRQNPCVCLLLFPFPRFHACLLLSGRTRCNVGAGPPPAAAPPRPAAASCGERRLYVVVMYPTRHRRNRYLGHQHHAPAFGRVPMDGLPQVTCLSPNETEEEQKRDEGIER